MERIQEALAKARAERQRGSTTRTDHAAPVASDPGIEDGWQALAPVKRDLETLRRNRVVAVESGHAAAPYDLLRTKIIHQAQSNGWRRIAIVSPDPAAGKTTTLANLAFSFERQRDMRVMCIDLDLRRPNLHRVLGQTVEYTMADVLEGRVRFAEHGMRLGERVAFGLNGGPASRPSELLLSRAAREGLDAIERDYSPDLVFYDISPLNVSDDNIAFLQNVDCALIIAAAEQTPTGQIDHAERQVAELTNVMGIVLNKCRYASDADGYDYQYY
ncbi:CpsD/CapB family tyrosine-protein kinase [Roseovarius sp. D22-M7]|uniref:CpsD/CapB family tyrosine-protein kinase n=1 Tax=Roseovarius sp. D22-M7 TaxID=3127116 RepID=UPI00300F9B3B